MEDYRELLPEFGRRLRQMRKEMGLTQEEFAERACINSKYYSQIERGDKNITLISLDRIAMGFDVSLGELFRFPTDEPLSDEAGEAVALMTRLIQKGGKKKIRQILALLREM